MLSDLYIGLMSGTSVDSIDAVLVDFSDASPHLIASLNKDWPLEIRNAIFATRYLTDNELSSLQQLDSKIGDIFAQTTNALLKQAGITTTAVKAIGSHGQTIRHQPNAANPFSLQIGDATRIAQQTNINVVSNFRTADIEMGGQGAPLVPAFHQAVFHSDKKNRAIVNIGGIANITALPKQRNKPVIGFDTGPGNNLMDAWSTRHKRGNYDKNGDFAASGTTNTHLLAKLLRENYFQLAPPKSTGFELFNLTWLDKYLASSPSTALKSTEVQSTLCDLTAISIIQAISQSAENTDEIYICGGGVHNKELMRRLQMLTKLPVTSTQQLGIHPDWVEAMTFAWLAKQRIKDLPGNLPAVTGAKHSVVLGNITYPNATPSRPNPPEIKNNT